MKEAFFYPDSAWNTPFIGGSHEFLHQGARLLDARSYFFFYATGITPAMAIQKVGAGSAYAAAFVDAKDQPMDGGKSTGYTCRRHPGQAVLVAGALRHADALDAADRSAVSSIGSQKKGVAINPDPSVDVYFGPTAPAGKEGNWVQTWPGKGGPSFFVSTDRCSPSSTDLATQRD